MERLIEAVKRERRKDLIMVVFSDHFVVYDKRRQALPIIDKLNELGVYWTIGNIKDDWMLVKIKRRASDEI